MSRRLLIIAIAGASLVLRASSALAEAWQGVDETVVEKFAQEAGRPSTAPLLNTDRGDLLLFLFLLAGAVGGFVMGYFYRVLFPPRKKAVG